jgi:mRNA-degrading endonuclease HigB of HigAB toxin-antitoxin module
VQTLLGKNLIDDCKKSHPTLRKKLDSFCLAVEKATWNTPVDLKATFASADPVGDYYAIDVGGKKGARVIILIQFAKLTVMVVRVFVDHKEYSDWTNKIRTDHTKLRKQGKKKKL